MGRLKILIAFPVLLSAMARPAEPLPAGRTISFSGYDWRVKSSSGKVGPGPNYFSDSSNNVWVDGEGRLHMRITRTGGRWYCAEVISNLSFGSGTYRFYLDSPVDSLNPYVVLGLFTWSDDPAYNNKEIDVEFSRWGNPANANAQYVVQPYTDPEKIFRFTEPPGLVQTTHSFLWQSAGVFFHSLEGHCPTPGSGCATIKTWTCSKGIPVPGDENARINLWLYQGKRPTDGKEVEIVIRRFEFDSAPF